MLVLLVLLFMYIGTTIGYYKIFEKAGLESYKALIPGYNFYVWLKYLKKPMWWLPLLLVPIANIFIAGYMLIETAKCFRRYGFWDQGLATFGSFAFMPYLGFSDAKLYGPGGIEKPTDKPFKKSKIREWADAIIFAVLAATLIRMFVFEAYTIPTSSMEGSLLVGDFLFVSKMHYGPRVPNTPIAFPFAHHTIWPGKLNLQAYSELIKLPYKRLKGFQEIKRNDIVVFNFPAGDTVVLEDQARVYDQLVRQHGRELIHERATVKARPVDKRENYIKRCVAVPGDEVKVRNANLFINGEEAWSAPTMQYQYFANVQQGKLSKKVRRKYKIDAASEMRTGRANTNAYMINETVAKGLAKEKGVSNVEKKVMPMGTYSPQIFPHNPDVAKWNVDQFGPIKVPAKGMTVQLNPKNFEFYERCIRVYEGNDLVEKDSAYYIDGVLTTEYTFKMDYYFMMGDNRHNSLDSRAWGFVPEDHIVGKAWFIFMSLDKSGDVYKTYIRFKRLFASIHHKWAPQS